MKKTRLVSHGVLAALAVGALACGIGDDLVSGVGNSGNRFYASPVMDELAEQLASSELVAPVTDDMLRSAFDAIVARAADGDSEAALVLFRVAEAQRKAEAD